MLKTLSELLHDLGDQIRVRRSAMGWSRREAASRSGVAYSTWRRLEAGGGSVEDLVRAAVALRCEEGLAGLFPEPAATSMDQLLRRQASVRPRSGPRIAGRMISRRDWPE